ncbi:Aerobic glycerol-3-phosphate dehydrogenase [Halioglobus japonicus]|nr:Aerobic glycerol-3-phosphate dehydrogenase [Halioglobus japonicus]
MNAQQTGFTDRDRLWQSLEEGSQDWDLVVVGGGIIGAGILREAARRGLKTLLVEQRDYAWGTSSRSSKMVHGGLRYISHGDIKLTRDSLRERERLLREAPGLIERMGYHFTLRKGVFPGRIPFSLVLWLYDKLAGIKDHRYLSTASFAKHYSGVSADGLTGAMYYTDTVTDDARLVLRVLQEAIAAGGAAMNYTCAKSLIKKQGQVAGVVLQNVDSGAQVEVRCKAVINATGAWADRLRNEINPEKRIRPLRGSHLVLPREKLPVPDSLSLLHPIDKRPVFIFPWEGATVVGTTDLDHKDDVDQEASINTQELDYLLQVIQLMYPDRGITEDDILSTWSGVRPVIGSEKSTDPSKERRDHAVWVDGGMVTVSGGKLTTFRLIALDALAAAEPVLGNTPVREASDAIFQVPEVSADQLQTTDAQWARRLIGRYGNHAQALLNQASAEERELIGDTQFCLAECRWAARHESVLHLDDLLLRRTRLGSLLKNGGDSLFPALKAMCETELHWDDNRWQVEEARYREIWRKHYYLPTA